MKRLLSALIGLSMALPTAHAATWYVSTNGNDLSSGATWAEAKETIQAGINVAGYGDIVLVSNGTWLLTGQVVASNAVTVRSAYGRNLTVINGDGPTTSNRCFHLGAGCSLDGFTVTSGYVASANGGGVLCHNTDNVITNCIIMASGTGADRFGGGVYLGTLHNCILTNNSAEYGGGAFGAAMNNCTLAGNSANYGGGAHGSTLNNCTTKNNSAAVHGGGAYNSTLTNCTINNNTAEDGGGAYNSTLNNCTINNNSADGSVNECGGGAYGGTLTHCTLTGNFSDAYGGGAYNSTLNNCTINNNSANVDGGGAHNSTLNNCTINNNSADGDGGGAYGGVLNNCLLSDNLSFNGGGAYGGTLNNCTLCKNTASSGSGVDGSALYNCIVFYNIGIPQCDSATMFYTCAPDAPAGNGNITGAPLFVDKDTGNYQLSSGSPCINTGNNQYALTNVSLVDLADNPRIFNTTVDMGAYEYCSAPPVPAGVSASDGLYTDKVRVTWNSATNATGYQVWRHTANVSTSAALLGATATNTYDDTGAIAETTYYYWVKSTNSMGASDFSAYDTGWRAAVSIFTNRWALLVGIDNYSPAYGPSSLATCTNDAVGMRDIFMLGDPSNHWSATHITLYTDQQATKAGIRAKLNALAATSGAGDLVVYLHSSHGGTSGGSNTFICAYDASFTDAELAADLALFPSDTKVIIILDTCYSAGMFKSDGTPVVEWLFAERVMEHYYQIQQTRFKSSGKAVPKALGQNIAFMTASDYDEYSYCSSFYSRYIGYLIQGCNVPSVDTNADNQLSFLELHDFAATNAMAEVPSQHAQSFHPSILESTIARAFGIAPVTVTRIIYNDFDGDRASDMATFNPATGHWRIASLKRWEVLAYDNFVWGGPGFRALDGDYDGDGASDLTVYHATSGEWRMASFKRGMVLLPSAFFGGANQTPVSGDFDGDGISDAALYEQPDGFWYIIGLATGAQLCWGQSYAGSGFIPVSGDFDGDRVTDLGLYHTGSGYWYIGSLARGKIAWGFRWGDASMRPVSGDYDGDGYTDLALYQPSTGKWYIGSLRYGTVLANGISFGGSDFTPVPGDYDGDGYDDLAVYHAATGYWFFRNLDGSQNTSVEYPIGGPGYLPVLPTW